MNIDIQETYKKLINLIINFSYKYYVKNENKYFYMRVIIVKKQKNYFFAK